MDLGASDLGSRDSEPQIGCSRASDLGSLPQTSGLEPQISGLGLRSRVTLRASDQDLRAPALGSSALRSRISGLKSRVFRLQISDLGSSSLRCGVSKLQIWSLQASDPRSSGFSSWAARFRSGIFGSSFLRSELPGLGPQIWRLRASDLRSLASRPQISGPCLAPARRVSDLGVCNLSCDVDHVNKSARATATQCMYVSVIQTQGHRTA